MRRSKSSGGSAATAACGPASNSPASRQATHTIFTLDTLFGDGWAAVAIVAFTLLVARPVAVFVALAGTRQVDTAAKAFMAWFGPKGVATMTFALFVLGSSVPEAERIGGIAALAVFVSVIVHGLTDHPGSEWMARRAEAVEAA